MWGDLKGASGPKRYNPTRVGISSTKHDPGNDIQEVDLQ